MQTETQTDYLAAMREAGERYSSEPVEVNLPSQTQFLEDMKEAGEKYGSQINIENGKDYEKKTKEEQMALCTHRSGHYGIIKLVNGRTKKMPRYCNHCKLCYKANAKKLQDKVEIYASLIQEAVPDGQWRKKIVDEKTEAQSLKKHIKRNQDGRHLEMACDFPGKSEIYSFVVNEPGKNMDAIYGEVAQPEDKNFDELYALNRSTGKKLSKGAAFKSAGAGIKKEDTERLLMPQIIVKDIDRQDEAADIIHDTNYVEIANSAAHAAQLYAYQFKFIVAELEKAGIEIAAIRANYYNMAKDELLNDWNGNVKYWQMSVNAPIRKEKGIKMDNTSRLVFPKVYEPAVN